MNQAAFITVLLASSLALAISDNALDGNAKLNHASPFLNASEGQISDSDLDNIKNRTLDRLNAVRVITASYDGQVIRGIKSGNSYLRSPMIVYIVGELQIDENKNIGLANGSITGENDGIEYANLSYSASYANGIIDSKMKFNKILDNNLIGQEIRMIIIDNRIYSNKGNNWTCVYSPDKAKEFNVSISQAETRKALISRINSGKKLIFEGMDEVDQEPCIKLRLFPDLRDFLISMPEDQSKDFIAFLELGAEYRLNESLWISAESFLPKKEFWELTAILPREGLNEVADFVRVSTTNHYDFNRSIFVQNIVIPEEAKEVTCIEPHEAGLTRGLEIRGEIFNSGSSQVQWTTQNFAGFYYDLDKNIGTEQITFRLSNVDPGNATLSDQPDANNNRGIVYTTKAQPKNFKFKPWGRYEVIGFLSNRYFAAYDSNITQGMIDENESVAFLFDKSKNWNLMTNEQIGKVLVDDNKEMTLTSLYPLKLGEGYELAVKSIDENWTHLNIDLEKDGKIIDTSILDLSENSTNVSDKTYYYIREIGDTKGIVTVAVHFKNAFKGADTNIATVDGEFQISDNATLVKPGQQYDKMSIGNVDPTNYIIIMDNKDSDVKLSKNKDLILMQDIYIKTADQDNVTVNHPLRFYIYKKHTDPGTYELRGSIANLSQNTFTYANANFSGFYYDLDYDIGSENITFRLSDMTLASATLSDQPDANGNRGIVYMTQAQPKKFEFNPWGQYYIIGFLGEKYFAAYDNAVTKDMQDAGEKNAFLYDTSRHRNLMTNEQLTKVLIDDNEERAIQVGQKLKLEEGYELAVIFKNIRGDKAYLELYKDGLIVDSRIVQPSSDRSKISDETYYYKTDLGNTTEIVQIAVHFKNITQIAEKDVAIIDGIFQVSDATISLRSDVPYYKMFISEVNPIALTIKMDNRYGKIILCKNKDTMLMDNISIKTADQSEISDAYPLRYYLYKTETIDPSA